MYANDLALPTGQTSIAHLFQFIAGFVEPQANYRKRKLASSNRAASFSYAVQCDLHFRVGGAARYNFKLLTGTLAIDNLPEKQMFTLKKRNLRKDLLMIEKNAAPDQIEFALFRSGFFDEKLYLELFTDVASAIRAGKLSDALTHWQRYGKAECYSHTRACELQKLCALVDDQSKSLILNDKKATPHQIEYSLFRSGIFDEKLYLALFADVADAIRAGTLSSALNHWEVAGKLECYSAARVLDLRQICHLAGDLSLLRDSPIDESVYEHFDAEGYLKKNSDVRAAKVDALSHWLSSGRFEGRAASGIAPYAGRQTNLASVDAKPFGVNFLGMNRAMTGLGKASRGYYSALHHLEIPTSYAEISASVYQYPAHEHQLVYKIASERKFKVTYIFQNADMLLRLNDYYDISDYDETYRIGQWVWELPQFREDFCASFGAVDEIWVPSQFCRDAIQPFTALPVVVIPHVVIVQPENKKFDRAYFGLPEEKYVFAYIFDLGSSIQRKNPFALIRAFQEAFVSDQSVCLVLKIQASKGDAIQLKLLENAVGSDPRVILINKALNDSENDNFKRCVDCFVSPHKSEGFGLNIAEMLVLGKSVIATGYSGCADFFSADVGYPIEYDLIELDSWVGPYPPGSTWANPRLPHLVQLLRRVRENPEEAAERAARGQLLIKKNYSIAAVANAVISRFAELGLNSPIPSWVKSFGRVPARGNSGNNRILDDKFVAYLRKLERNPKISIIVPVYNVAPDVLAACVNSVINQNYPHWELCIVDDCSTNAETVAYLKTLVGKDIRFRVTFLSKNLGISGCMNWAASLASGEYVAFLDNDDVLHEDALTLIATEVSRSNGAVDVIYTDEAKLDEKGLVCDSYYKPDFSIDHLESVMYLLHFFVVRRKLFHQIGGFRLEYSGAQDYDLALRLSRATRRIAHIDTPLYLWRKIEGSASATVDAKPSALLAAKDALTDHAKLKYGGGAFVDETGVVGIYNLRKYASVRPPVTLVICTDNRSREIDGRGYINFPLNFVRSIVNKTKYSDYRILVVSNGSLDNGFADFAHSVEITVLKYPEKNGPFNYAAKINWAVKSVETEYFVMLNDDMEIFRSDWLDALMDQIQDPDVGVVGAKLLHADGSIQHAGVVITPDGEARHLFHGFPGEHIGYNGFTHTIRNYSAVTGACMATKRSVYDSLKGFDEQFAVDYNDIDFCLRLQDRGYRVVFNPNSVLFHFEGATVVRNRQDEKETQLFRARWQHVISRDPYYNKNLTSDGHDCGDAIVVDKRWREAFSPPVEQVDSVALIQASNDAGIAASVFE